MIFTNTEIARKHKAISNSNIYVDGNSISAGQDSTSGNTYPEQLLNEYPLNKCYTNGAIVNEAVGGQTTLDMIADAATNIDTLFDSNKTNILLAWEARNHLVVDNPTLQVALDKLEEYCLARKTANSDLKIITATILPSWYGSYGGDTTVTGYNNLKADTVSFNQLLRDNYTDFADYLIDFETIADFGLYPANEEDGYAFSATRPVANTYYSDGTHLNDNGYSVIAKEFNKAIWQIL